MTDQPIEPMGDAGLAHIRQECGRLSGAYQHTQRWSPLAMISVLARLDAEIARANAAEARVAELSETFVDDSGTTWNPPTAWAYHAVCRARDKWQARAEAAEARIEAAEAECAAALARALPEPVLMETVEQVGVQPSGNYLVQIAGGRTHTIERGGHGRWYSAHFGEFVTDSGMVGRLIAGPLPDIPIPTTSEEPNHG